jgi:hypothetical protein
MAENRRKLIALDVEDLQVISAHCQDSVLKVADMAYHPAEKRMIIEMNRFIGEKAKGEPERRRSVLHFERVEKVTSQGLNLKQKGQVLSMLAIVYNPLDKPAGTIDLVFSGAATVRLFVECIEAQLSDMKASWSASSLPKHPEE